MIKLLRQWLYEPSVRGVDVDDNTLLEIHSDILKRKPLLRSAFNTFYRNMSDHCDAHFRVEGLEIELGSGAGFFKSTRPAIITSDVRKSPRIDIELDAQAMPFPDESVRCIYAINVFHHLPDPELFFHELIRVLKPGAGCILIEPHGGPSSAFLHKHLHTDEYYDLSAANWRTCDISGPLSGANQALAHITFTRDRQQFIAKFGNKLEIIHRGYELNALRYLLSGGLNFRQLFPSFLERPLSILEYLGRPLAHYWSLHQIIVIRKR